MKMQDKELDELFRSNLDELEFTPSPGVWAGIDAELEKGGRKKLYIPFLSIAASIIVLFTIGFLFIPKKIRVGIETKPQAGLVKTQPAYVNALAALKHKTDPSKVKHVTVNSFLTRNHRPTLAEVTADSTIKADVTAQNENVQLASIDINKTDALSPVSPVEHVQIESFQPIKIKKPQTTEMQQTIAQVPAINAESAVKPKHPTLSLGSLINAMVAKVDKRKDKIIEFTDDDGDSNITGVNLGIIKLKKDQQTSEK